MTGRIRWAENVQLWSNLPVMKVRQYCYFAVDSAMTPTSTMTALLGIEPDVAHTKGDLTASGRVRGLNEWRIVEETNDAIDDQIQRLIDRLAPCRPQLVKWAEDQDISSRLQIVRYYHDPDGSHGAPGGTQIGEARKWPRPLGWHLSVEVLQFLSSTSTDLDVDEYDFSPDEVDTNEV
ncbi:DUF4279 domain-containing protein [Nocardia sp. CA-151230]|uniref:DUF4279 domain-containing protein n=1 Tax=Nocardia sp. CA-151230 TaxID=3239982 RepID=UPI003D89B6D7